MIYWLVCLFVTRVTQLGSDSLKVPHLVIAKFEIALFRNPANEIEKTLITFSNFCTRDRQNANSEIIAEVTIETNRHS